jgi:putative ABC transport system permease protein
MNSSILRLFFPRRREPVVWFLLASLIIAVVFAFVLTRLSERVYDTFIAETSHALGADRVYVAETQPSLETLILMQKHRLDLSQTITLYSMIEKDGDKKSELILANIKAVDGLYPLYGGVLVQTPEYPQGMSRIGGPPHGTVWVEAQLLKTLEAQFGDSVRIGERTLKISGIILEEPDRLSEIFLAAPRIMMRYHDLLSTGLIGPGTPIT